MDFRKFFIDVFKGAGISILEEFEKAVGIKRDRSEPKRSIPKQDKDGIHYGKPGLYFDYGDWQHKLFIGKHGSGKNTLAENFVLNTPHGVAFLDNAKGSSITNILRSLPEKRLEKTVVLDHSNPKKPLGLGTAKEVDDIFENDMIVGQWEDFFISNFDIGDLFRTRKLIRYAMKAIFGAENTTILDSINFVEDQDYRDYILSQLDKEKYKDVLKYWNKFDEGVKNINEHSAAFLNRTGNLEGDTILKTTLGQHSKLNYEKWVNNGYTVLIKVPEKDLPTEAVRIISAVHMIRLWRACLSRGDVFDQPDKQFTVICDEPQGWLKRNTKILDNIFSKARAYRMNIICLIQSIEQIRAESSKLLKIILHNKPDILALTEINLFDFDWGSLNKYQFLARVQGQKFVGKGLKPPKFKREADDLYRMFRDIFNEDYRKVLERRFNRWEKVSTKEKKKSKTSQDTGLKKTSNTESQSKTEKSSDSSIVTNW